MQTADIHNPTDLGRLRLHGVALLAGLLGFGGLLFPWSSFAQLVAQYKALTWIFFVLGLLTAELSGYFLWRAIREHPATLWEAYSPFFYSISGTLQLIFGYFYLLPVNPIASPYLLGALGLLLGTLCFSRQSKVLSGLLQGRALGYSLAIATSIAVLGLCAIFALGGTPRSLPGSDTPVAKFLVLSSTLKTGEPIEFDAGESQAKRGKITKYDWDFGDGVWYETDAPSGAKITHVYYEPGRYEVMLRVSDERGEVSAAYSLSISVERGEGGLEAQQSLRGQDISGMAWDGRSLWIADRKERAVYATSRAAEEWVRYELPQEIRWPAGLEWDGTHLWVADDGEAKLYRLDSVKLSVLAVFNYPGTRPADLAWDGQYLWVVDEIDAILYALDPENGRTMRELKLDQHLFPGPLGLAWDGLAFWVADIYYGIRRIHPQNGAVLGTMAGVEENRYPIALAWDSGSQGYGTLLIADHDTRRLYQLRLKAWGTEKPRGGVGPTP